jgi:large subunit ribosomal protein L28
MLSSRCSPFAGSMRPATVIAPVRAARSPCVQVQAKKVCQVTGKKRNKANNVSFSNKKNRTFQEVNLQVRSL